MSLVPVEVTRQVFRTALVLKKNSPNIMFVGGLAGVITSTVLACRATLKLSEELPVMKQELEDVRETIEDPDEQRRAVALVYGLNASKVVKLYAPSVLIGGASIGALTGSHVQLTRRNAGLTAAYAASMKAYDEYRARAQAALGEEKEKELHRGIITEKVEGKDGKKKKVEFFGPDGGSAYSRFFDDCSRNYVKNAEYNRMFLKAQQQYATDMLQARGHLFLNEVYEDLGFEHTGAGAVVGWVISDEGDNFVDFGLYEARNHRFINGIERVAHLDFNVDGVIYDKI